ncbi:endonuclease domain-containing protein [Desulfovermiculus halophilus]|jgi:very-short-patch-repair endonuclease|uniref:endonuclease domain-containing protein n=1 Tax=Desulfovermiculus halophilus TaxID=339722 RepID=UPI00047FB24F|nr:endonuclease domain-containing protein [Desulfovermiculus halophilus]
MSSPKHNNTEQKRLRQKLRKEMTPAEVRLWNVLKGRQLDGRKFRRQQSLGPYIVDFYCPMESLVIELDGEVHNNAMRREYDVQRQAYIQDLGMIVLRFENRMVFEDIENVIATIRRHFCCRSSAGF